MKVVFTDEGRLVVFAENSIDEFALLQWSKAVRKSLKKHPKARPLDVIDIDVDAYQINNIPL